MLNASLCIIKEAPPINGSKFCLVALLAPANTHNIHSDWSVFFAGMYFVKIECAFFFQSPLILNLPHPPAPANA